MISLDVIAGYFLPGSFGWIFLIFVLISESLLLSKYLTKTWIDNKIIISVLVANIITTIIGYFLLDEERNGGHLLSWIPVEQYQGSLLLNKIIALLIFTFLASVLIETFLNWSVLKKRFPLKKILLGTFLVNLFTYTIGGIIIFLYDVYL